MRVRDKLEGRGFAAQLSFDVEELADEGLYRVPENHHDVRLCVDLSAQRGPGVYQGQMPKATDSRAP